MSTSKNFAAEYQAERVRKFLKALPHLEGITDTGLKNISSRFGITVEELKKRIEEVREREALKKRGSIPSRNTTYTPDIIVNQKYQRHREDSLGDRILLKDGERRKDLKEITRVIHRWENKMVPGALMIYDDHAERLITPEDLERLKEIFSVEVFDLGVTPYNKHLFTDNISTTEIE